MHSRFEGASLLLVISTTVIIAAIFGADAWVSEDAYITLRTVDNLLAGNGLRWNIDERVQTYTHPLWLLLFIPFRAMTRELPLTLTALGLACSVGAYLVVALQFRRQPVVLLVAVFAPFALSQSIARYATSGFENPLSFLLVAFFAVVLVRAPESDVPWTRLALIAALAFTNRLDIFFLLGPALAHLVLRAPRSVQWRHVALGLTPLVAWLSFSLFYYGFFLPNTAYAKLSSALPRALYLEAGASYLVDLVARDPVSAAILVLSTLATAAHAVTFLKRRDAASGRLASLGTGVVTYCLYVVWAGGDFLSGRFLALPTVLAVFVCAGSLPGWVHWTRAASAPQRGLAALAVAVAALAPLLAPIPASPETIHERPAGYLYRVAWNQWQLTPEGAYFQHRGNEARENAERTGASAWVAQVIGIAGFAAGPDVLVIDQYGVGDPLLARLPPVRPKRLKPGHLGRRIPRGYLSARNTGSTASMHPALAAYYEKLRLLTTGPLLAPERLATIAGFQLGAYDHLLEEYLESRD